MNFSYVISTISAAISLKNYRLDKKRRTVEALTALQRAVIKTREFIEKEGYKPNTSLSDLWLSAFEKIENANLLDDDIKIENIYRKSQFWSNPNKWRKEKASMELIPTLKDLEDYCDTLLVKIKGK